MPKARETTYLTFRGRVNYAKILGKPVDDYEASQGRGNGKEWKLDFIFGDPTGATTVKEDLARLKKAGVGDRVKQKEEYLDGQAFLPLRQRAQKADGTDNEPIDVTDVTGEPWNQSKLIGNDSVVDVKIRVVDYGKGFKHGIYVAGVRVLDLVPYNATAFEAIDKNDPYYAAAKSAAKTRTIDEDEPEVDETEEDREPAISRGRQSRAVESGTRVNRSGGQPGFDDNTADDTADDVPFE